MKKLALALFVGLVISTSVSGQTFNGPSTDWNTATNWSTNPTVPRGTGTDVTIASNVVVNSPNSDLIGNISVNNNTAITVSSGATLQLGSSSLYNYTTQTGTKKNLTYSNQGTLTVGGILYIYGDLIVNNKLTLDITGTMIVYGSITMSNGGVLDVSGTGTLQVKGNLTTGNTTTITTSGSGVKIAVDGSISVGGGSSSISGPAGSITAGSGCSCGGCTGSVCGSTVLPILLNNFSAALNQQSVLLKWSTASEFNFDYFSLQRSSDGTLFNEIAQVKGHGTTNEMHSYSYEDTDPIIGRSYYRLTSVDFDNYQETFKVISVDYQGEKRFRVSPNPSDGSALQLSFNFANEGGGQVIIYDNLGSVVGSYQIAGSNSINIDNTLRSGVYLAKYTSSSFTKTERFIVK